MLAANALLYAQVKDTGLIVIKNTDGEIRKASFDKKYYFGFDLVRAALGDIELYIAKPIMQSTIIELGIGYDFNFYPGLLTNYGTFSPNDTGEYCKCGSEAQTGPARRRYWGEGFAARFSLYLLKEKIRHHQNYGALEVLVKQRDYENVAFNKDGSYYFNESAHQVKTGFTYCWGKFIFTESVIMWKIYMGLGFRALTSNIHWHSASRSGNPIPDFSNQVMTPSISGGVAVYF
jgi:hypothetical protein